MPIKIVEELEPKNREIAWICSHDWELPIQIEGLKVWLKTHGVKLSKSAYVADIGYCPRPGALGGGGVLDTEMMEILVKIGMDVFLSEYPPLDEEK